MNKRNWFVRMWRNHKASDLRFMRSIRHWPRLENDASIG